MFKRDVTVWDVGLARQAPTHAKPLPLFSLNLNLNHILTSPLMSDDYG